MSKRVSSGQCGSAGSKQRLGQYRRAYSKFVARRELQKLGQYQPHVAREATGTTCCDGSCALGADEIVVDVEVGERSAV
eukprot:1306672-Rhodomonas_salina.2